MSRVRQNAPTVESVKGHLNDRLAQAWAALAQVNDPPRVVRYRGRVAELVNGRPEFVSEVGFRPLLGAMLNWTTRSVPWWAVHLMWGEPSRLPIWKEDGTCNDL